MVQLQQQVYAGEKEERMLRSVSLEPRAWWGETGPVPHSEQRAVEHGAPGGVLRVKGIPDSAYSQRSNQHPLPLSGR